MIFKWVKKISVEGYTYKAVLSNSIIIQDGLLPSGFKITYKNESSYLCEGFLEFDLETNMQTLHELEKMIVEDFEPRIKELEEKGWQLSKEESILPKKNETVLKE